MKKIALEPNKNKPMKHVRLPNGFGSIVTLSGNRRRPFHARKTLDFNDDGYPIYETIGYFEDWMSAFTALTMYNQNNSNPVVKYERPKTSQNDLAFEQVYERWFKRKFENPNRKFSDSTKNCMAAAFQHCKSLHKLLMADIKATDMQKVIDNQKLSHATMEHIKIIFNQVSKYALEFDIIEKNYAQFVIINKVDDDKGRVPFSNEDIKILWDNKDIPGANTILILIYTGWRINELLKMPLHDISLSNKTMTGGSKTKSGKNRVVPIHSKILPLIESLYHDAKPHLVELSAACYRNMFKTTLANLGIKENHTPHDCRHTFATLLSNANADPLARKLLMGHSITDFTDRVYTHKDVGFLRTEIEKI